MNFTSDSEEFQKKKSFLMRRNAGKFRMEKYRQMIAWLFPHCTGDSRVLDLAKSDRIRETSVVLSEQYDVYKRRTTFADKETLRSIVRTLLHIRDTELYFFSSYAEYCGLVLLPSLTCLNVDFDYNQNFPSMFWFRTTDMENELFIDFGEEDGDVYLEIEVAGRVWSFVTDLLKQDCS